MALTLAANLPVLFSSAGGPIFFTTFDGNWAFITPIIFAKFIADCFASELKQITLNYETNITKDGKIRAEYIPYITYQDRRENRDIDAPREKANLDLVRKFFKEGGSKTLVEIESSPSIRNRVVARVLEPIVKVDVKKKNKVFAICW